MASGEQDSLLDHGEVVQREPRRGGGQALEEHDAAVWQRQQQKQQQDHEHERQQEQLRRERSVNRSKIEAKNRVKSKESEISSNYKGVRICSLD